MQRSCVGLKCFIRISIYLYLFPYLNFKKKIISYCHRALLI